MVKVGSVVRTQTWELTLKLPAELRTRRQDGVVVPLDTCPISLGSVIPEVRLTFGIASVRND